MEMAKKVWGWFGKKLVVVMAGLALTSLKQYHPEWPLPSDDLVRDLVVAFLGAHTLTDVVSLIKTAVPEVVKDVVREQAKKESLADALARLDTPKV